MKRVGMRATTIKQFEIMKLIIAGNGRDEKGNVLPLDLDELLERLSYKPSKESIHFSLRALVRNDMIFKGPLEKRRNRLRVTLFPTETGKIIVTGKHSESFLEPTKAVKVHHTAGLDEILAAIES